MECVKAFCKEPVAFKVHGYAECGQDGNFVYQWYCAPHMAALHMMIDKYIAANEEYMVIENKAIYDFTGLEYITAIEQI